MNYLTYRWKSRSAVIFAVSLGVCALLWSLSLTDWASAINANPQPSHEESEPVSGIKLLFMPMFKVTMLTLIPALLCLLILKTSTFIASKLNKNAAPTRLSSSTELVCSKRVEETRDVATFYFPNSTMQYVAGQFVMVTINIDGTNHRRAYSLSSTPSRTGDISITVKRVNGGLVSNYLLDNLRSGMPLELSRPMGQFNLQACKSTHKVVMISAGCGITPIMSMTRYLLDNNTDADIKFIHFAKSTQDLIFRDEIKQFSLTHSNFTAVTVLSEEKANGYEYGLLSDEMLSQHLPDLTGRTVFTCGPTPFMALLKECLQDRNFNMQYFHQESFGESPVAQDSHQQRQQYRVSLLHSNQTVEIDHTNTLLDAIEAANVSIITECRSGVCGACKCKVTKGSVEPNSTLTLSEDELAQGYVLACSAQPTSDVVLELP